MSKKVKVKLLQGRAGKGVVYDAGSILEVKEGEAINMVKDGSAEYADKETVRT